MATTSQLQVLTSVKGDTHKVHKNIVCERAGFFARAVKFGGQEVQIGTIDLPKDDPEVVKLFTQYIYGGEYEPALSTDDLQATTTTVSCTKPGQRTKRQTNGIVFPHVCIERDSRAKDLAKEKFSRACKHFWSTSEFLVAAYHAFSTTIEADNGLRDLVSETISEHMELAEQPEVRVLLKQFSGLALGVLDEKIKEHGWGKEK